MKRYNEGFYARRHRKTLVAAETILSLVLEIIPPVHSAVDVGCGVGTWLTVLQKYGAAKVLGIDGPWVDRAHLEIAPADFLETDLTQPLKLPERYDLAISLEVAEHLPPASAEQFVESLTELADFVLFSAAIPGQGGDHHLNEQWQDYWAALFAQRSFATVDRIREQIWRQDRVPVWYRQNTLLFVRETRLPELRAPSSRDAVGSGALARVHPDLYLEKVRQQASVNDTWNLFRRAIRAAFLRKLGHAPKP